LKVQSASLGHFTTAEHPFDRVPTNITMGDVVVSAIGGDVIEIDGKITSSEQLGQCSG